MRARPSLRTHAAAAAAVLALAACGQDTATETADAPEQPSEADSGALTGEDPEEEPSAHGEGTEADVEFVQGMIPHHRGAIEMAALVEDRTDRQELQDLADEIIAVQADEIELLEGMLARLGAEHAEVEDLDHDAMGMPDEGGIGELEEAEGEAFDRLFLEQMIAHHEGAISMAEDVLREGEDDEVAALAEDVITAQEAEIEQMRRWLEEWDLA